MCCCLHSCRVEQVKPSPFAIGSHSALNCMLCLSAECELDALKAQAGVVPSAKDQTSLIDVPAGLVGCMEADQGAVPSA